MLHYLPEDFPTQRAALEAMIPLSRRDQPRIDLVTLRLEPIEER